MSEEATHSCPDCKTALTPIRIVDQLGGGRLREGLAFTRDAEPKTSGWTGAVKNQDGVVEGYLCDSCARVLFYAKAQPH